MSNAGVNTGFAKCFIVFMAIVILVEGVVYLALAIWGFLEQECSAAVTDIESNPFGFAIHLIYFQKEKCGQVLITDPNLPGSVEISMNWSDSYNITYRMYVFLICYAVVSALWILTSLMVLFSVCGRITNKVVGSCYWPWFLIVLGGCVLDAVATGFFAKDITETTSAHDALNYIGADVSNEAIMQILQAFDPYFITPSVVMLCISCRVVLVWLLNLCGVSFCLSLARVLMKNNAERNRRERRPAANPQNNAVAEGYVIETAVVYDPQQQQQQRAQQQFQPAQTFERPESTQIQPKPLPIQSAAVAPAQNERNAQAAANVYPPLEAEYSSPYKRPASGNVDDHTTYRNTETHPDRLNYPSTQAAAAAIAATAPPPSSPRANPLTPESAELSTISPLNTRYSSSENAHHLQNQPQRVSAELRSQLPWSYTGPQQPPPTPRKPQMAVYPEIPEPDYGNRTPRPMSGINAELNAQFQQQQPQQQQQHQSYSRW